MILQLEVTNEEAAFFAHLMDLGEGDSLSHSIRVAPGFLFKYATDILQRLEERWVCDLFSDRELEMLLKLWPVVYNTEPPTVADLRQQATGDPDFSSLDKPDFSSLDN